VLILLAAGLAGCASSTQSTGSLDFTAVGSTHFLTGGHYAVRVANECGTTVETVVGQIQGGGWSDPLLNGTPITVPLAGKYTVVDPIGNDLMGNTPPCELSLTVALTRLKS
jgi:hypothetical protein